MTARARWVRGAAHTAEKPSSPLPRAGAVRSPTRGWLLAVVTLGVYAVANHFRINRELRDFGVEVQPVMSALALFPGVLVIVPSLITLWRTSVRIGIAQETAGLEPSANGLMGTTGIVLWLFVPYHQWEVNRVWLAER